MRACLGSERSGVQIPIKATHFFFQIVLSQINIGLNISVAIGLIANLLQLKAGKHWWHYTKTNCFIISQPSPF
jgi:hypothetical protein